MMAANLGLGVSMMRHVFLREHLSPKLSTFGLMVSKTHADWCTKRASGSFHITIVDLLLLMLRNGEGRH
jgi:hypothetical protein